MWYVYIIQCADNSLYTGITTDISRRINAHNRGKGGNYTRARQPAKLVYYEPHPNRSEALKRELEIKTWPRTEKIKLIEENR